VKITQQDFEDRARELHPSRRVHVGWELRRLPLSRYPKKPEPLDTLVVSYRLAGMSVDQIAAAMGMTAKEIAAILKPWGHERSGSYFAWPEYLPGLKIPDYLPQASPNFDAIQRELVAEAEQIAKKECVRRGLPSPRKRRARRRYL